MLKRTIVCSSESSSLPPVVSVWKGGSIRFSVDYRTLNKIKHPVLCIGDALDTLQGAEYFCSLDLKFGYGQIPMNEADKEKTTFAAADGLYNLSVRRFRFFNAPAIFERMIDNVLRSFKGKTCLCYIDDIVSYSYTFHENIKRLDQVLTSLSSAGPKLNAKNATLKANRSRSRVTSRAKMAFVPTPTIQGL